MSSVSEILKRAREEKEWSLERISEKTKIRIKYLEALEKGQYDKLPGLPYIKGFLKNYARTVNLDPDYILALFRREFKHEVKMTVLPESYEETRKVQKSFVLTLKEFLSKIIP